MRRTARQIIMASSRWAWTLGLVGLTLVVMYLLTIFVTPYTAPASKAAFYDPDKSTQLRMVRAQVVEKQADSVVVKVIDGGRKDQVVTVKSVGVSAQRGDTVLIADDASSATASGVIDVWRLPALILLAGMMVILVLLISGARGLLSIGGLVVSIGVIGVYIIPRVLAGADAFMTCMIGAFGIATISIIVAHGLRWRTLLSLASVYIALIVVVVLTLVSGSLVHLTGTYDEASSYLASGASKLDMYGILLGGIILASLGVLDDVVTTQVAAIDEISQAHPKISKKELYSRGLSIGREHISALINTLALAYAGVSLPTILIMANNLQTSSSFMLFANYEYISQEVVRTLIASIGIVLAVPISTGIATLLIMRKSQIAAIIKRQN